METIIEQQAIVFIIPGTTNYVYQEINIFSIKEHTVMLAAQYTLKYHHANL